MKWCDLGERELEGQNHLGRVNVKCEVEGPMGRLGRKGD